jgi:hypothetical protein
MTPSASFSPDDSRQIAQAMSRLKELLGPTSNVSWLSNSAKLVFQREGEGLGPMLAVATVDVRMDIPSSSVKGATEETVIGMLDGVRFFALSRSDGSTEVRLTPCEDAQASARGQHDAIFMAADSLFGLTRSKDAAVLGYIARRLGSSDKKANRKFAAELASILADHLAE